MNKKKAKVKSVNKLKQTDGEVDSGKQSILDQFARMGASKYQHATLAEYTKWLSEANTIDIYNHAATLGIVPRGERDRLIAKLINEYKTYSVVSLGIQNVPFKSELSPERQKEFMDILKMGR